jgi:hypothetical protein
MDSNTFGHTSSGQDFFFSQIFDVTEVAVIHKMI